MTSLTRRGVAILGSTGSVGQSTLNVLEALADRFEVVALAAATNATLLEQQVERFSPSYACLTGSSRKVSGALAVDADDPLSLLATLDDVDIVVVATTGHAAIPATIAALKAGKTVALANKETVVAAGEIVMPIVRESAGRLHPVDSEHSAIWQCLPGGAFDPGLVDRIIVTASGGPFREKSRADLERVSPADALDHPTWSMGTKITVDSATLINKGFELIEAHWLFNCPMDRLDILIHPQSIVHSMVEFRDGAILAQLGSHDMRIPIQYALTYPERPPGPGRRLTLEELSMLTFAPLDAAVFQAPELARQAVAQGSTYPAVLSAADTLAVAAFLDGSLSFLGIVEVLKRALDAHKPAGGPLTLEAIDAADAWTGRFVSSLLKSGEVR